MTEQQSREALVESLAEKLSTKANARAVYGEPIEREGATVIPVAQIRLGFGGGSGNEGAAKSGSGGGGGMRIDPLGFIRIEGGKVCFSRIRRPASFLRGVLGMAMLATALLVGLRPIARLVMLRQA